MSSVEPSTQPLNYTLTQINVSVIVHPVEPIFKSMFKKSTFKKIENSSSPVFCVTLVVRRKKILEIQLNKKARGLMRVVTKIFVINFVGTLLKTRNFQFLIYTSAFTCAFLSRQFHTR